ncbi:MAG: hypothetical protein GKR94_34520 [Gammaproteobacteria bacterium]|nr:hypothetical protein [Gammaproteobacteria bacterium]
MAREHYPSEGSIVAGMIWMLVIQVLLFWLPFFGPLIAGVVGGKSAGGIGAALAAVFLPAIIFGVGLFFLGSLLSGIPLIGAVFGLGAVALVLTQVGPLLLGAIIGGIIA